MARHAAPGAAGRPASAARASRDGRGAAAPRPPRRRGAGAARQGRVAPRGRTRTGPRLARRRRVHHLRVRGPGGGRRGRGRGTGRRRDAMTALGGGGVLGLVDRAGTAGDVAARLAREAQAAGGAGMLIGSSFDGAAQTHIVARAIRAAAPGFPLALFPGSAMQLTDQVDLVLFLSLVSGRNAQYLIEEHVRAVPFLERHPLPTLSTAHILIDGGRVTSVESVSQTRPLPADKPELAAAHATAAQLIGMQAIYLQAGSRAQRPGSDRVIPAVRPAAAERLLVL